MAENLPSWSPASGGAFCPDWPQATRPRIPWLSSPSAIKICDSFLRRSSRTALLSRDEVANLLENVACISELRQPSGTRKPLRKRPLLSTIWLLGSSGRTGSGYIHAERAEEHPAPLPLAVEAASIWLRPAVRGAELVARIRERICGGPKVRIHLSPAASLVRTCPSSIRAPKICQSGRRHAARIPQKPSADTGARTAGAAR